MTYLPIDDRGIDKTEYNFCCRNNTLYCTVGLPRSGKSTWARRMNYPVIDTDGIRLALTGKRWYGPIEHEVWALAKTMIRALFFGGNKIVILDAPQYQRRERDLFLPSPDCLWNRYFVVFDTSAKVCKERAIRSYPELCDVIDWFDNNWEPINEAEEGRILARKDLTR